MSDPIIIQRPTNKKIIANASSEATYDLVDHFITLDEESISTMFLVIGSNGQQYIIACSDDVIPHLDKFLKIDIINVIEIAEFGYDIETEELTDLGYTFTHLEI